MERCLFCEMFSGQLPEGNHAFLPENICDDHRETAGVEAYLAAHPNGAHTETCGCVTLTYLSRGIQGASETDKEFV